MLQDHDAMPRVRPGKPAFCRDHHGELTEVTYRLGDDTALGVRALCPFCGDPVHVLNLTNGMSAGPLFLSRNALGLAPRPGYWNGSREW
jgi:hypothetical protein